MKLISLTEQEAAESGFTHMAILNTDSFLESAVAAAADTAATGVTFPLFTTKRGDYVPSVVGAAFILVTPFQDTTDAAFNDVQVELGDANDRNGYIVEMQVNLNGTEVYQKYGAGALLPVTYDSAVVVNLYVGSMTAKKLSHLNKGKLLTFLKLMRIPQSLRQGRTGNETIIPS